MLLTKCLLMDLTQSPHSTRRQLACLGELCRVGCQALRDTQGAGSTSIGRDEAIWDLASGAIASSTDPMIPVMIFCLCFNK